MNQQVVYDQKWHILLRRAWLFRFVSCVDFVLVAGSMATGVVQKDSDFDVIVGCRSGRIFTARFFCVVLCSVFGWRRFQHADRDASSNKFCFNHFITPASYQLSGPYNRYWRELYCSLVPIYGDDYAVASFYASNQVWSGCRVPFHDMRYRSCQPSYYSIFCTHVLSQRVGDFFEMIMRFIQVRKIYYSFSRGHASFYKPRFRVSDEELEFHMNTRRIEIMMNTWKKGVQ